jgi:predicted RNA binding protein YcfA (HicA-like mRNA interferase family)
MANCAKLLEEARNNPKGVRIEDACKLAECFGFEERRGKGSHRIFKRAGFKTLLNFQGGGMAKEYQVKQLLEAIDIITAPTAKDPEAADPET